MKSLKSIYNLRYEPTVMSTERAAKSWADHSTKLQLIVLGDNGKFWVCCPADAGKLVKAGYEYLIG